MAEADIRSNLVPLFGPPERSQPTVPTRAIGTETGVVRPQDKPFTPPPVGEVMAVSSDASKEAPVLGSFLVPLFPEDTVDIVPSTPNEVDKAENLPTATEGWYEDPLNATRAVLDGVTYGFSDEISAGVLATLAHIAVPEANYSDVYNAHMAELQQERNIYTANNPKASLALNFVGGVLSPINKPLGLVVGKAVSVAAPLSKKMATLVNLSPKPIPGTAQVVQEALRQGAVRPVSAVAAPVIKPTAMEAAGQFVRKNLPVAVAGGALYGAGAAEPSARTEGAIRGAVTGAVATPLFAAFPAIGSIMSRRRVAQELGKGPTFVPLTLAADVKANPWLSMFYRNIVGRSFVGRTAMDNQAQRWYTPIMNKVDNLTSNLNELKNLSVKTYETVSARAKAEASKMAGIVRNKQKLTSQQINTIIGDIANLEKKIANASADAAQLEQATIAVEQLFRSQAFQQALPDSFSTATRGAILEALELGQADKALRILRTAWQDEAFPMLNDRKFRIGVPKTREVPVPDDQLTLTDRLSGRRPATTESFVDLDAIASKVVRAMEDEGSLDFLASSENKIDYVKREVINFLKRAVDEEGFISGAELATLRGRIGNLTASRALVEDANTAGMRAIFMSLKDVIDDVIVNQLGSDDLAMFMQHKDLYKQRLLVDAAVSKATNTTQRGNFTPEDWVSAANSMYRRRAAEGTAPYQKEAYSAVDARTASEAALISVAKEQAALNNQKAILALQEEEARLTSELSSLKAQVERIESGVPQRITSEMAKITRTGAVQSQSQIRALEEELALLRTAKNELMSLFPRQGRSDLASPAENALATSMLGAVVSKVLKTSAMLAGMPIAAFFSSPSVQRLLAGQTWWQALLQKVANSSNPLVRYPEISGGRSAVAGSEDRDISRAIYTTNQVGRANIYRAMEARGSLESFKQEYPQSYKLIENAYNEVYK